MRLLLITAFLLTLNLNAIDTVKTKDFIYTIKSNGIPNTRISIKDGSLQVFTNINKIKINEKELKKMYNKYYHNKYTYPAFKSAFKNKFKNGFYGKIYGKYKWLEFNEYKEINKLTNVEDL